LIRGVIYPFESHSFNLNVQTHWLEVSSVWLWNADMHCRAEWG